MPKDPMQRYAESLERTIQHNYNYLKENVEDFQGLCKLVTPEKSTPQEIVVDIRELYKEIRNRLTEIKAIQQLLQGKYHQFYQRKPLRDKEIMEFGCITKNCYSKFEYTLLQKQTIARAKEEEISPGEQRGFPCQWFRSKEHQVIFIRNLRVLHELNYERPSDLKIEERREVIQHELRHLTLFFFKGEANSIDDLYSRMRLREHDIIERYARDELHGLLTHLREINPAGLEDLFQRFMESKGFSKLKCLLMGIHSPKDLEGEILDLLKKTSEEMTEGEVKMLSR